MSKHKAKKDPVAIQSFNGSFKWEDELEHYITIGQIKLPSGPKPQLEVNYEEFKEGQPMVVVLDNAPMEITEQQIMDFLGELVYHEIRLKESFGARTAPTVEFSCRKAMCTFLREKDGKCIGNNEIQLRSVDQMKRIAEQHPEDVHPPTIFRDGRELSADLNPGWRNCNEPTALSSRERGDSRGHSQPHRRFPNNPNQAVCAANRNFRSESSRSSQGSSRPGSSGDHEHGDYDCDYSTGNRYSVSHDRYYADRNRSFQRDHSPQRRCFEQRPPFDNDLAYRAKDNGFRRSAPSSIQCGQSQQPEELVNPVSDLRTLPLETIAKPAEIFGSAKLVDTSTKLVEVEKKLEMKRKECIGKEQVVDGAPNSILYSGKEHVAKVDYSENTVVHQPSKVRFSVPGAHDHSVDSRPVGGVNPLVSESRPMPKEVHPRARSNLSQSNGQQQSQVRVNAHELIHQAETSVRQQDYAVKISNRFAGADLLDHHKHQEPLKEVIGTTGSLGANKKFQPNLQDSNVDGEGFCQEPLKKAIQASGSPDSDKKSQPNLQKSEAESEGLMVVGPKSQKPPEPIRYQFSRVFWSRRGDVRRSGDQFRAGNQHPRGA